MAASRHPANLPLVYACSGCSSAAQAANHIALALDRAGAAEMSCISGVGGNVAPLVSLARSGRPILALDGCPLACTKACLAERGIVPERHVLLHALGVRKRYHSDFDRAQADRIAEELMQQARSLTAATPT